MKESDDSEYYSDRWYSCDRYVYSSPKVHHKKFYKLNKLVAKLEIKKIAIALGSMLVTALISYWLVLGFILGFIYSRYDVLYYTKYQIVIYTLILSICIVLGVLIHSLIY